MPGSLRIEDEHADPDRIALDAALDALRRAEVEKAELRAQLARARDQLRQHGAQER